MASASLVFFEGTESAARLAESHGYRYVRESDVPIVSQVIITVLSISLLVIVHELGHYLAARAFGMRVTRFSIGIGPTLAKFQPKGSPTVFQIGAIPFMAYVMIAGMNPAEDADPNDPSLFPNKGVFARMFTIFAGPLANYLAASVMIFGLVTTIGWRDQTPVEPMTVGDVMPETPAARAGLVEGDVILRANGHDISNVEQLIEQTKDRAGLATEYVVKREDGSVSTLMITPSAIDGSGKIGVTPRVDTIYVVHAPLEALDKAISLPWLITIRNLEGLADMVERRTTEGLTGPIGMGKLMAAQVERGAFDFVWLVIVISVALGLFNLLPIPALDGGRLVFLGYELITRRRPNERIEQTVHAVGLLFLLGLIVLVSIRDLAG